MTQQQSKHIVASFSALLLFMVSALGWALVELYKRDTRAREVLVTTAHSVTALGERMTNNEARLDRAGDEIERLRDIMNSVLTKHLSDP